MNSQSDEIPKLIISSLKNKRDKTSNATRPIVASGTAKSSTPLTTQRISFYSNDKISRVVPHKNATVLVKNSDETKECVCLRILEKTIEATYHSFCNENPKYIIKLIKFGELRPRNLRLRKMAQRAVCCCTIHMNVGYLRKAAIRYCQIIGQDSTTISCNEKLCDNILCEEANIKCYHQKCTDCKAKFLT